jgi:copper chaperone CopZ
MEKLIFEIPSMYGDHHVLRVRDVLAKLNGIKEIYASSAWKQLMIHYDPKIVKPSAIEETLANAGYPVGAGETPVLVESSKIKRDPQWQVLGIRITETNKADIEMSGEFRRY